MADPADNEGADPSAPLPPLPPLPLELSSALRASHGFGDGAHWVIPGVLMQGSRPGFGLDPADGGAALVDRVRALVVEGGIRTFVSLQAECVPEEGSCLLDGGGFRKPNPKDLPPYADVVARVADDDAGGGARPRFLYYGIVGMQPAQSTESLSGAVADLAARIKSGDAGPAYVHCGGGVGRAGLVCACLLGTLYPTLTADEAMAYTTGLCYLREKEGEEGAHYSSPETEGQKEQVREFFDGMRAAAK